MTKLYEDSLCDPAIDRAGRFRAWDMETWESDARQDQRSEFKYDQKVCVEDERFERERLQFEC